MFELEIRLILLPMYGIVLLAMAPSRAFSGLRPPPFPAQETKRSHGATCFTRPRTGSQ